MAADVRMYVASLNTAAATELTLRTIRKYAGYPFDLFVGDSGSKDRSLKMLRRFERAGWLELEVAPRLRRHAEWLDQWVATCPTRYAVFVDSDMEFLRPGWLAELVAVAERERAALVASRIQLDERIKINAEGIRVRWAARPSPWLMLVDIEQVRALEIDGATVFGFRAEPDPEWPGGRLGYDTAAFFYAQLVAQGMHVATMPEGWPACYHHFGGMSEFRQNPSSQPFRQQKQAMKAVRVRFRLALARARGL